MTDQKQEAIEIIAKVLCDTDCPFQKIEWPCGLCLNIAKALCNRIAPLIQGKFPWEGGHIAKTRKKVGDNQRSGKDRRVGGKQMAILLRGGG